MGFVRRWRLKHLLAVPILAGLIWYLAAHWDRLGGLLKLDLPHLAVILAVTLADQMQAAENQRQMLKTLSARMRFGDLLILQNATGLLNYLPMWAGTVSRAAYLKRRAGVAYSRFGALFVFRMCLMVLVCGVLGLIVLAVMPAQTRTTVPVLLPTFAIMTAAAAAAIVLPIPAPSGEGRLRRIVRSFLTGRKELTRRPAAVAVFMTLLVVHIALASIRLGTIYHSMGVPVRVEGFVILGVLSNVASLIVLTPGALGLRELLLAGGAMVLGVPPEVGLLAAMIDAAVCLGWAFTFGLPCAVWLWYKVPEDVQAGKDPDARPDAPDTAADTAAGAPTDPTRDE